MPQLQITASSCKTGLLKYMCTPLVLSGTRVTVKTRALLFCLHTHHLTVSFSEQRDRGSRRLSDFPCSAQTYSRNRTWMQAFPIKVWFFTFCKSSTINYSLDKIHNFRYYSLSIEFPIINHALFSTVKEVATMFLDLPKSTLLLNRNPYDFDQTVSMVKDLWTTCQVFTNGKCTEWGLKQHGLRDKAHTQQGKAARLLVALPVITNTTSSQQTRD